MPCDLLKGPLRSQIKLGSPACRKKHVHRPQITVTGVGCSSQRNVVCLYVQTSVNVCSLRAAGA